MKIASISQFVTQYGYLLIFIITALENSLFVGLLIPGVVVLLVAGFLAAQNQLNLFIVMAIAFAGGLIGDNTSYWIGRKGGRPFLERYSRFLRVSPERLKEIDDYYSKHGGKTVFAARFTAVLHTLAPVLAGVSRMRYSKFVIFNAAAGFTWSVTIPALGFFFGESLTRVKSLIGKINIIVLIILVIAIFFYIKRKRAFMAFRSDV